MRLLETNHAPPGAIDKDAGVFKQVKLLGRSSRNGREYSDQALRDAAALYEGMDVTLDHDRKNPDRERGVLESVGKVAAVRVEADGVYGDLHYWKTHPAAPVIVERVERDPSHFGISHNATGKTARRHGKHVVESISRVASLDLVLRPATSTAFFESEQKMPTTIKQFVESLEPSPRKALSALLEMEGMPDMPMPEPSEESSVEDQISDALRTAIMAVVDGDMDDAGKLAKIKEIFKMKAKLSGEETKSAPPADDKPAEDKTAESVDAKIGKAVAPLVESIGKLVETLSAAPAKGPKPIVGRAAQPGAIADYKGQIFVRDRN